MAYGARLESVLGESPRGFESPILRHCDGLAQPLNLWESKGERGLAGFDGHVSLEVSLPRKDVCDACCETARVPASCA